MALTPAASVSAATLAIYIVLIPIIIYIGCRHGKHGFLGWLLLFIFALLQLISSGIQISDSNKEHPSTAGLIISIIGLSPLLLGAQGVLHEVQLKIARQHFRRDLNLYTVHHVLVVTGVALTAVGASKAAAAATTSSDPSTDPDTLQHNLTLWRTGASLLFIAWLYTIVCSVLTCVDLARLDSTSNAAKNNTRVQKMVTLLLRAVLVSLPFVGIRTIYGLVYAATQSMDLSPATGTVAVRVCLMFLPQLLAVLGLMVGGLVTLGLNREAY